MSPQTFKSVFLVAATMLAIVTSGAGQNSTPMTASMSEGNIIIPVATGVLGKKDPAALAELGNHFTAVGSATWFGMQGTGTITYGSKDATAYTATLSNLGNYGFRLDAQTSKGPMSVRIDRFLGKSQGSDGQTLTIPPEAAFAGLFPFQLARMAHYPDAITSIYDHGNATIGSATFHRITLERASLGRNPFTKARNTVVTDLYFDPSSHLLIKSVTSRPIPDGRNARFLFVITYGDYRQVGSSLIPFRYTETMQGQPYWTLQLSTVDLNPTLDPHYFEF